MSDSPVLVIDPISSGALYAPLLAERKIESILLDTPRAEIAKLRPAPTPGAYDFARDFDNSPDRLLAFCLERGVRYVVAGSESSIALCEFLRTAIPGCPANTPTGQQRRWDKEHMFKALVAAGIPCLETTAVPSGQEVPPVELDRVAAGRRVVVKPSIGAGSIDVRMVGTPEDLVEAADAITKSQGFFGDQPSALIQEMYPAPSVEYVVDTFTADGKHEVVAVCAYDKRLSAGGDFIYERVRWLGPSEPVVAELVQYAEQVLDVLGVQIGPVHMEIMSGAECGPRLIDFGARAHGAGHPLKTFKLTGTSQIHRECEYIADLLGQDSTGSRGSFDYTLPQQGAIIFFNLDEESVCSATPDAERLGSLPGVVEVSLSAKEGQRYPATRTLMDSLHLGLAFIVAPDDQQLDERCAATRREFDRSFAQPAG